MKNLATIIFISLLTIGLFSVVTYTSCKKSEQQDILACQNGGTYSDGACKCPDNFKGKLCETVIDSCKYIKCLNGGVCVGVCRCPANTYGRYCEINLCKDVQCQNGGTCDSGFCRCPLGYAGTRCEKLTRDLFIGTWAGADTCDGGLHTADIVIDNNGLTDIQKANVHYTSSFGSFNTVAQTGNGGMVAFFVSFIGDTMDLLMTSDGETLKLQYTIYNSSGPGRTYCSGVYKRK